MRNFADRADAGRQLAQQLDDYRADRPVVLGLPRGGVVVAWEVAQFLGAPLDTIVVRKLGVPWQPELAMGAIGESGVRVIDEAVIRACGVDARQLADVESREREVLQQRALLLRRDRPPTPLNGRTAIIVDDGVATGSTARAACRVARASGAGKVVLAVPVGPPGLERAFEGLADQVVCLTNPRGFRAVGQVYRDFGQTSDHDVAKILRAALRRE